MELCYGMNLGMVCALLWSEAAEEAAAACQKGGSPLQPIVEHLSSQLFLGSALGQLLMPLAGHLDKCGPCTRDVQNCRVF